MILFHLSKSFKKYMLNWIRYFAACRTWIIIARCRWCGGWILPLMSHTFEGIFRQIGNEKNLPRRKSERQPCSKVPSIIFQLAQYKMFSNLSSIKKVFKMLHSLNITLYSQERNKYFRSSQNHNGRKYMQFED